MIKPNAHSFADMQAKSSHPGALPRGAAGPAAEAFYLPSLDGMRAVAAVIVFLSHAGWGHLIPGGFGVTVFFFLSGYLITTLLRREMAARGRIDFAKFYLRRAYRIFPPMYLMLLLVLLLCLSGLVGYRMNWAGFGAQLAQVSNYYILHARAGESALLPYTGTYWSLAVEEHFYILFPALFVWGAARWRAAGMARLFLLLCVAELAWRCLLFYGLDSGGDRTYLASDTRMDGLLFGCIMGVWMNPALDRAQLGASRWSQALILAGAVAALLFTFLYRDEGFRATLRYTVQGLALFPLFWFAVREPGWPPFRPLNLRPVRLLGELSYVFYLSHLMWLGAAWHLLPDNRPAAAALAFALTVAFSWLMHQAVELPFARLRRKLHS